MVGPFLIAEQEGQLNYRLELPPDAKTHSVFHISPPEPADPITPLQTTFHFEPQEDDVFAMERIMMFCGTKYWVKWKDYDESESTWKRPDNPLTCLEYVKIFHQNPVYPQTFQPGHYHVDLTNRPHFLCSFPLRYVQGRCAKCDPRPRARSRKVSWQ